MTAEDDFVTWATGLPADRARRLGFRAEPCYCNGEFPGCSGYQLAWSAPAWLPELRRAPEPGSVEEVTA